MGGAVRNRREINADGLSLDAARAIDCVREIIEYFDGEPEREGLRETGERHVKFLDEFLSPAPFNVTTFENEGQGTGLVMQSGITFYSICEHHLVPFFGTGAIAYIPGERIVGLSKLARVLDHFARRYQNQERITSQVADFLEEQLKPKGVAVILRARHLCVEMRGIRKPGTETTTSIFRGELDLPHRRHEVLSSL